LQYPGHAILSAYLPPPDHGLTVIHADTEIIVVDKPAGLLSVPGRGQAWTTAWLRACRRGFPMR
jgi:tRNA pseudouridine32 synthase/23S rRNA pseudouridine746 synthase